MNLEVVDNALQTNPTNHGDADTLVISGKGHNVFDADAFDSWLRLLGPARGGIEYIRIQPSAHLVDCEFLQHFPNVRALTAHGSALRSLAGIRRAEKLETLLLSIPAKNRFDLSELRETDVRYLRLEKAGLKDLLPLRSCKSLQRLEIVGGELDDVAALTGMSLADLAFIQCKIKQINCSEISSLAISVVGCRDFERFDGHCNTVKKVVVESCSKFDVATLDRLGNVQEIAIVGMRGGVTMSRVGGLSVAEKLTIADCRVEIGDGTMPRPTALKKVWVSPLGDEALRLLSLKNSTIWFCNGKDLYHAGIKQADMQRYYSL